MAGRPAHDEQIARGTLAGDRAAEAHVGIRGVRIDTDACRVVDL